MTKAVDAKKIDIARPSRAKDSTDRLAILAIEAALSKKATNIAVIEMTDVSGVADYFVICTGGSEQQIRAIADEVRFEVKQQLSEIPWHKEGEMHYSWVVLDYVDVVVHIMDAEKRAYYQLERLWGDANIKYIEDDSEAGKISLFDRDDTEETNP
jgi:ribosome-associated protein